MKIQNTMKKNLLVILVILLNVYFTNAQIPLLWGVVANGGAQGQGAIIKIYGDSTGFDTACSMVQSTGYFPGGHLVLNGDGMFYGTCFLGGTNSAGALFRVNPSTNVYTDLYNLDSLGTSWVNSDLVRENDSTFYGVIIQSGIIPYTGRLFRFNPFSNAYTTLYSYNDTLTGEWPRNIMVASNHKIYGTTTGGGLNNLGVLFSFDPSNNTYTDLHDFDSSAYVATGTISEGANGLLYGVTGSGGTHLKGTIFSFDTANYTYITVHDFDGTTGQPNWNNGLTKASNNKFYGMTYLGGQNLVGVIFCFDPSGNAYGMLHEFDGTNGAYPISTLMQASDNKLYGMTNAGGSNGDGIIFRFDLTDSSFANLKNLSASTGSGPYGGLTEFLVPVNIVQLAAIDALQIYPNPATDKFRIHPSDIFRKDIVTITIQNVLGEVVRTETASSKQDVSVDVKTLSNGIYFVSVTDIEKQLSTKLVIRKN